MATDIFTYDLFQINEHYIIVAETSQQAILRYVSENKYSDKIVCKFISSIKNVNFPDKRCFIDTGPAANTDSVPDTVSDGQNGA